MYYGGGGSVMSRTQRRERPARFPLRITWVPIAVHFKSCFFTNSVGVSSSCAAAAGVEKEEAEYFPPSGNVRLDHPQLEDPRCRGVL